MKKTINERSVSELDSLCSLVRALVAQGAYNSCMEPICHAMGEYPHAPQPHNLLGIILEKMGDHYTAMKHFRAAWALDPTYLPASHNLNTYGTFFTSGGCAFDESDIKLSKEKDADLIYDENGIARVVRKRKI